MNRQIWIAVPDRGHLRLLPRELLEGVGVVAAAVLAQLPKQRMFLLRSKVVSGEIGLMVNDLLCDSPELLRHRWVSSDQTPHGRRETGMLVEPLRLGFIAEPALADKPMLDEMLGHLGHQLVAWRFRPLLSAIRQASVIVSKFGCYWLLGKID